MKNIFLRRLAAGLVASMLAAPGAVAQQQGTTTGGGQTGGTQTGGTQTGGTQTGTSQTGGSTSGTGSSSSYSGQSTTQNRPSGMNTPQVNFGAGGTNTQASGAAGRTSIGRRAATGSTGQRGTSGMGLGTSSIGRGAGGQSSLQTNRQTERRAQFVTRIDQSSFATGPSEPGSTLELRSTVEQSVAAAVPSGVQVSVDGSSVVLSGKVSSATESKLAERMALLEPGVRSVRNELVVETKL